MKLSGNKKNGRYAAGGNRRQASSAENSQKEHNRVNGTTRRKKKSRRAGKILISFLVVIKALGATIYSVYNVDVRPPNMKPKDPFNNPPSGVSLTVGLDRPDVVS